MAGVELGTGYVQLTVSAKGIGNDIKSELGAPIAQAADKTGKDAGKALASGIDAGAKGVKSSIASAGTEVQSFGKQVSGLKSSFNDAGTLSGKFSELGGVIKSAASNPLVLAGGIAAVGAAALGAVTTFEHTAIAVGKFSDATGIAAPDASRLYEALSDLGVAPESVQTAFNRLNKEVSASPQILEQYGVAVGKAKDGTTDVKQTFLNAVDALNKIEDPAKRAEAGTALFGKGWQNMAEVIGNGAPALQQALDSVQPSKVFSDADIKSAKGVRDGFDAIKDAGEGLVLTAGKALAPAFAKLGPLLGDVITKVEPLARAIGQTLAAAIQVVSPLIEGLSTVLEPLLKVFGGIVGGIGQVLTGLTDFSGQIQASAHSMDQADAVFHKYGINQNAVAAAVQQTGIAEKDLDKIRSDNAGNIQAQVIAIFDQVGAQSNLTAETGRLQGAADAYLRTQAFQEQQTKSLGTETDRWTAKARAEQEVMVSNYAGIVNLTIAMGNLGTAQDQLNRQTDIFGATLKKVGDESSSQVRANIGLSNAYDGLTQSVKDNGQSWDLNTAAGRANFDAVSAVADNIRTNLVQQLKDSGGNYDAVTRSADLYRQQLVDQMTQAGATKQQIADYIRTLGLTPAQVTTAIKLTGDELAKQNLQLLNVQISDIPTEKRTEYLTDINSGSYQAALALVTTLTQPATKTIYTNVVTGLMPRQGARAAGGPVKAGYTYLVGEQGPELATFGADGYITPHAESMATLSAGTVRTYGTEPSMTTGQSSFPDGPITLVIEGQPFTAMIQKNNRDLAGTYRAGRR